MLSPTNCYSRFHSLPLHGALQITNEMLAALKLPAHPLLAPCLLFGGSNTHGCCLSSYGGETLEQLQQQLQELEQLVMGLKGDIQPDMHQGMMHQLQEKRVQLFLCLLVCMLLAIETFQSPVSPCWNPAVLSCACALE